METLSIAIIGAAIWTGMLRPIMTRAFQYLKALQDRSNFLGT
jgi:hypothetical protein